MDMRIPPLKLKIMLESNPLKSRILIQRLAVALFTQILYTHIHIHIYTYIPIIYIYIYIYISPRIRSARQRTPRYSSNSNNSYSTNNSNSHSTNSNNSYSTNRFLCSSGKPADRRGTISLAISWGSTAEIQNSVWSELSSRKLLRS